MKRIRIEQPSRFCLMTHTAMLAAIFCLAGSALAKGNGNQGSGNIQDRLDGIEMMLEEIREQLPPSVTASFCMSQQRAIDLGLKYAAGLPLTAALGVGYDAIGPVAEVTFQPFIPGWIAPPVPLFLPNEVAVGLGTAHGRGMEICVDLPVELGPRDTELLMELAADIQNSKEDDTGRGAQDYPNRGKFQRRAHRVLNYAKRRVPGIQSRLDSEDPMEPDDDASSREFDRMDRSVTNLQGLGLRPEIATDGLGVFRDANVTDFASSFDETKELGDFMNDPEQIFSSLPDRPLNSLTCTDLGVAGLRSRVPQLARLCEELELLPSFDLVKDSFATVDALRDEILAAVAEIGVELSDNAEETAAQRRERFCATTLGRRNAFDKYCRR